MCTSPNKIYYTIIWYFEQIIVFNVSNKPLWVLKSIWIILLQYFTRLEINCNFEQKSQVRNITFKHEKLNESFKTFSKDALVNNFFNLLNKACKKKWVELSWKLLFFITCQVLCQKLYDISLT